IPRSRGREGHVIEQAAAAQDRARSYAATAGDAFTDAADFFARLTDDDWRAPTGCEHWEMRTLAGHIVGEAVWFANLARGVTVHEPALPDEIYEELKTLPPEAVAERIAEAAAS